MNIRTKLYKSKQESRAGKWIVRIIYTDGVTGREKEKQITRDKRTDAVDARDLFIEQLKKSHGGITSGSRMAFDDLATVLERTHYKQAKIVEGLKTEGVRSLAPVKSYLKVLREYFGKQKIGEITTANLRAYQQWRLRIGSRRPEVIASGDFKAIKLTTINRELQTMRMMMNHALAQGWITRDIFHGSKVIVAAAEKERTRVMSEDEERRLLAACERGDRKHTYTRRHYGKDREVTQTVNSDNPHLKAIILLAVDSGMRRGEILKLRWSDIDFKLGEINIIGSHTKTERERDAPLSFRAKVALMNVRELYPSEVRPFPLTDIKTGWRTALEFAGITDLHFHDLRRTAITRWQKMGLPLAFAGKLAGHANPKTTQKHYTAADAETTAAFTETMNQYHAASEYVN
ncbi:MAG: site-specific integrase [Pyrinomonadaceae bacterium]